MEILCLFVPEIFVHEILSFYWKVRQEESAYSIETNYGKVWQIEKVSQISKWLLQSATKNCYKVKRNTPRD